MKLKNFLTFHRLFGKKIIHVEAPHLFGKQLIRHLDKYHSKCYCICPSNYEYVHSHFGMRLSKEDFYKTLKNFYLSLKEREIDLQLHVHLSTIPNALTSKYKKKLIEDAYDFFKNDLGIIPKEIVFGWWAYGEEDKKIAEKLNLKIIEQHFHVYDYWMEKNKI